ncbi:MAG TPA: AAA family ATPase [Phycisphaerae bacterium]|nr:AAA family ATPase [Phycisphaerae bacterium]
MRVRRLVVENFRRIGHAEFIFEPATFLIGPNNTGKSSVIAALEALLSLDTERMTQNDILEQPDGMRADKTVITGYISQILPEVAASRGFKGRVVDDEFVYRKTLTGASTKPVLETREYPYTVKEEYEKAKTVGDLLSAGLAEDVVKEAFGSADRSAKLKKGWERSLPDALDFDTSANPTWVTNPGGIPQNVLSRLPRVIHVPAITDTQDIESGEKRHTLGECLSLLFEDLIQGNPIAETIQQKLGVLEKQMDPADEASLVSKLLRDVNAIIADVFPECGISIMPSLQGLLEVLRPKYAITLFSNIKTGAARQGTGLVRTCVFAMLRHHARLKIQKDLQTRPAIVAFEEPELYLHPSAANLLRDTIYSLGTSDQIICSTHSPWMIDLSQDLQSLSRMYITPEGSASVHNYGVSSSLGSLPAEDKQRVKMLQIFDDELSRVFFADATIIVEGDSEILAIRQTLGLLPQEMQKHIQARYQLARARGKASIVSLVKYLRNLGMSPKVMHDGDFGNEGAEKFNAPISQALGDPDHLVVLDKNLEEALGYVPPSSDKPFKAYRHVHEWESPSDVPPAWRVALCKLFEFSWPE